MKLTCRRCNKIWRFPTRLDLDRFRIPHQRRTGHAVIVEEEE